ncbi:RagB/SusD family nutrient uptake outer membrane protein [Pedobacter sp. ISL-68]|uniref:RagB/SusD family nutrient uptake outer membrane protein n=1 Tax=unclassified Pedobacter TaxID=2628915 RepID=UPI001BE586CA|nr:MULTISPECIES: RagB/SusD family nutrient uptake outer membrane protein [unclassified Pedobacter]MBT2562178.1 RagB/SusD family nutrient uptake outer membrane protein [Pedobacter sp. ISL-64]MBT2591765.1 RagB/SusD family nutrient uptake outer membrane protein [Pedobacter sp. ISL-68]
MKKYYYILIAVCCLIALQSCKKGGFLDPKVEPLTEAKVFADSTLTMSFLTDIYAYTGMDIIPDINGGSGLGTIIDSFETMTTNVAAGYSSGPQIPLLTSALTSGNHAFNAYYPAYYKRIRSANIFMKNIPSSTLSAPKKLRVIAEARFLRAWYYFALIRLYGGVQLMGDEVNDDLPNYEYKRDSYKKCIDYIATELDEAAKNLPTSLTLEAADYGRATSGACKALKARVLVTAASPLYNGNPIATDAIIGPLVSYSTTLDQNLWQKAADACKAVLDLPEYALVEDNTIKPGLGFQNMFITSRKNSEYIFAYNVTRGKTLELMWFPWSRTTQTVLTYSNPSENIVKAFGMKDGKPITASSAALPYSATNPYVNRDPRFDYSIIYNQAVVCNKATTALDKVDIFFNKATNAPSVDGYAALHTRTGYYNRKMCNDSSPFNSLNVDRAYPIIRFAEMVLGYAEALNELGQTENAVSNVIKIRKRAGILAGTDNRYGIPAGISQVDLRALIQNEYRVEFFSEGHWYYDTRRWKTAEVTEAQQVTGTIVTKELNGTFSYASITVINSAFLKANYFAPIPLTEILKGKSLLVQNPGW